MPTGVVDAEVDKAVELIESIDLSNVVRKLSSSSEGPGLENFELEKACKRYREFLVVGVLHRGEMIVPDEDADIVWHHHILDTQGYRADTQRVLGYFLHHFPYLGSGDEEEQGKMQEAWDRTIVLRERYFGAESIKGLRKAKSGGGCSGCSGGISGPD